MKIFNCDWKSILELCAVWNEIPEESREYFVEGITQTITPASEIDVDLAEPLVKNGFLDLSPSGVKYQFSHESREFHRLTLNLKHNDLFTGDNRYLVELIRYLKTFYTNEEREALTEKARGYRKDYEDLAMQAGSANWLRKFLTTSHLKMWYSEHFLEEKLLFDCMPGADQHFDLGKNIVQALIDGSNPVYLEDVKGIAGSDDIKLVAKAIVFLLQNVLVYLSLEKGTLKPVIGIYPFIREFIFPVKYKIEELVNPVTPCPAFVVDDMTNMLVAMLLKPVPVKQSDNRPYAKSIKEISSSFYRLPDECNYLYEYEDEDRIAIALSNLKRQHLVEVKSHEKKNFLEATDKGENWLKLSESKKLANTIKGIRNYYETRKSNDYSRGGFPEHMTWQTVIHSVRKKGRTWNPDLSGSILSALRKLTGSGKTFSEYSFMRSQILVENPYFVLFHSGKPYMISHGWEEQYLNVKQKMIETWLEELQSFMVNKAIPYGLICLGRIGETNRYAISLTAAGEYFLEERDTLPEMEQPVGSILIQPNFEIVFMARNPGAEVRLGQFCKRVSSGIGTIFKITRESVLKAASIDLDAAFIINALNEVSDKPVPQNVVEQIKSWVSQCRKVSVSTRILFTCPDAETALKVKSSGGDKVEQISDTVIAISDRKFAKALEKKLSKKGIFRNRK